MFCCLRWLCEFPLLGLDVRGSAWPCLWNPTCAQKRGRLCEFPLLDLCFCWPFLARSPCKRGKNAPHGWSKIIQCFAVCVGCASFRFWAWMCAVPRGHVSGIPHVQKKKPVVRVSVSRPGVWKDVCVSAWLCLCSCKSDKKNVPNACAYIYISIYIT